MASKKKAPATAIDTPEITAAVEVAQAQVEMATAPTKPKALTIAPYTGRPLELHRFEGADTYLRMLSNRVNAFERRLPDPADALSANEMERRENIKARTRRISRALSNGAGFLGKACKNLLLTVQWLDTLEEVSLELQAKLAEAYKVIPEQDYRPDMGFNGGPNSGNTVTARKIYALRQALTYLDFMECPQCYAMLDESQPVTVDEIRAPVPRGRKDSYLTGGSTAEEAYAILAAQSQAPPDAAGHNTYITSPRMLACPKCGTQLHQAFITDNSNLSELIACRPGANWRTQPSLYAAEQFLDEHEKEISDTLANVQSSIAFAESLESAVHEDDIEPPHVTDTLTPDPKAAAWAAIG
jgi:hypothetical protein